MHQEVKEKILIELAKGDRLYLDLLQAIEMDANAIFWTAIAQLKEEGKIRHYFSNTPPSATLTYGLNKPKPSKVIKLPGEIHAVA